MVYLITAALMLFIVWEASSISRPVRNFDSPPQSSDWELGLREAVHQAFLREHHTEPGLRDHLLEAPFVGKQENASPFGDVSVLARGQLYLTPGGYKFVQDADCDCHSARCAGSYQCLAWRNVHLHQLLALWTVKRIRHRDPHHGHVFEIEYTISPINPAIGLDLVRQHGYFNYNIPGHIFVVRLHPHHYLPDKIDKWYEKPQHFREGVVIGVGPDGYKHVLHSFPGFYSSYRPETPIQDQTTVDPKEYELYKKLIEALAAKTTPHRFTVTTPKSSSFIPTTVIQLPLETSTQSLIVTKPSNHVTKYSEPDLYYHTMPTSASISSPEPPKPITQPSTTTLHYFVPVEETELPTPTTIKTTTPMRKEFSSGTRKSTITSPIIQKTTRKKLPSATKKTTFSSSVIHKPSFATRPYTRRKSTKSKVTFPIYLPTEPMQPVTEIPKTTYPKFVTEQLPAPDVATVATVPYIPTTTMPTSTSPPTTTSPSPPTTTSTPLTTTASSSIVPTTPSTLLPTESTTANIIISTMPTTELTTFGQTTQFYTSFKTEPTTYPTTTTTEQSFSYNQPTTTVEYSTFRAYTHSTDSVVPSTLYYASTNELPISQTIPTTTYYYYFETEVPKTTESFTTTQVTTTPKQPTTESFTTTQLTTTLKQPTTISSTTNNFLVDSIHQKTTHSLPHDYDADDIFGEAPTKPSTKTSIIVTKEPVTQSDVEEELFGHRPFKRSKMSAKIQRKPKVIFKNFFTPSMAPPNVTSVSMPYTIQSFSTSISVEINKANRSRATIDDADTQEATTTVANVETKRIFDDVALQLVNHARRINYLNRKGAKSSKQPKYKRRSYSTKIKRPLKTPPSIK